MTKQSKSGKDNKIEQVDKLEDLKPGDGVQIAEDLKYEYGSDLQTEGVPVLDPATGRTITLRQFEFEMNPRLVMVFPEDDKQRIFDAHARQIAHILWGDGLRPYEEVSPRVVIDKKNNRYKIIVAAEARRDTVFPDRPQSLTKMLSTASKNGTARNKK